MLAPKRVNRPSLTSPHLESAEHNPPSHLAPAEVRIGIPGSVTPIRSGTKIPRKHPRPAPLVRARVVPAAATERKRKPTPFPATQAPSFGVFAAQSSTLAQAPREAPKEASPPTAAAVPKRESAPKKTAVRRPESIIQVAQRWGISVSDAMEMCEAVESVQSLEDSVVDPDTEAVQPRPQRRLNFAMQGIEEDDRYCCDSPATPTTPMSAVLQPSRASVTPSSPLFSPGVFTAGNGRLSFARPDPPAPDFKFTSPGLPAPGVAPSPLFLIGSGANRPEAPFPPTPNGDCRISVPDIGTFLQTLPSCTAV
eukprot:m.431427 g.431427  ORF g.431427 m.431427 type:complete len:309 (+) comp17301_c0_seq1:289-1215(+)